MYDTFKVECPQCGSDDIVVIEATHVYSENRLHFIAELSSDGFEVPVPPDIDGSTIDEVVRCRGCLKEFPLADLLLD